MSVARISCPQFLDVSLRSPQEAVDVAAVGVGGNLGHDPGRKPYERLRQRVVHPEDALEGREANLYLLPDRRPPLGPFAGQQHVTPCQRLSECTAAVGEISKELPRRSSVEHRLVQQLLDEEHFRGVSRGELVGDGYPVDGADEVQLEPVDTEGAPPHPRRSLEACRLRNLSGMQHLKQRRVHNERLRITDEVRYHRTPQGLQMAPEPANASMERGGMHTCHVREQMNKESLNVAQERPLALDAPQLLEERKGKDLRVRKLLERLVALPLRVEKGVSVVHQTEQDHDRLFQGSEGESMLGLGHPRFLSSGSRMAPFLPSIHATDI